VNNLTELEQLHSIKEVGSMTVGRIDLAQIVGCFEHGNKLPGVIRDMEILTRINDYQLLKVGPRSILMLSPLSQVRIFFADCLNPYRIQDSQSGDDTQCCLLGCKEVKFDRSSPIFGRNVMPPSSECERI
jgi:hypothetical protein